MITGFITRWAEQKNYFPASFSRAVDYALGFIGKCGQAAIEPGTFPIDGENMYAIVQTPTTEPAADRPFEIHKRYIDIQILIQGREMQGFQTLPPAGAPTKDEMAEKDIAFYPRPDDAQYITLSPMQYVIYFPGEQHSPICTPISGPIGTVLPSERIVKIVIKILATSV